jgi:hypothetical protein
MYYVETDDFCKAKTVYSTSIHFSKFWFQYYSVPGDITNYVAIIITYICLHKNFCNTVHVLYKILGENLEPG